MKIVSVEEAVSVVKSNNRVFFQGAAMTPNLLIDSLVERYRELENIDIVQIHPRRRKVFAEPYNKAFHLSSFVGTTHARSKLGQQRLCSGF